MTVEEMIEALQKCDPKHPVIMSKRIDGKCVSWFNVLEIEIEPDFPAVHIVAYIPHFDIDDK